jgi:phosphatidylserine/phosphatidylglycerophosphate/cardiolipin synthase-like enzyme
MARLLLTPKSVYSYSLPDDGDEAKIDFLNLLHNPGETWIRAFGFNMPELYAEIEAADSEGIAVHILIDHTQSCGPGEKTVLAALAAKLKHGDITITTAGETSHVPGAINHNKQLIVAPHEGQDGYIVWSGSVNFSDTGFTQGNDAFVFDCDELATSDIERFNEHRDWAHSVHSAWQIMQLPTAPTGDTPATVTTVTTTVTTAPAAQVMPTPPVPPA